MTTTSDAQLIEARDVHFRYGRRPLFEGINFDLPKGSITGLLGKNGEGKTTLLKLISGLLLTSGGSLHVDGCESRRRSVELLSQVYYLPEEIKLPATTVERYFDATGQFYPNYSKALAREILSDLELPEQLHLGKLSMGQKKKVALAMALSLRVPLLLLDEPTNGLDIPSKSMFRQLLVKHISDDQTVLISTHQVRDLEQMIDRLMVIHHNDVICNETIYRLSQIFRCGIPAEQPLGEHPLYSEPTMWGEIGLYAQNVDGGVSEDSFSMEIFFNALMANTDAVLAHLRTA